jgi:hypothetical protein
MKRSPGWKGISEIFRDKIPDFDCKVIPVILVGRDTRDFYLAGIL